MSIESDLKKDGITVIEPLDTVTINMIAKNVSQKLCSAFPNIGFTFDELFERFSGLPMYIANIPHNQSEASYFYKNSSIYFRDGMGFSDLEKYAIHELIHNIQERKDDKGNLTRLGLCTFRGTKSIGMALNEAAVQIISSNVLGLTFEDVTYYGITFSTISPDCYPLICSLLSQMTYITGEEVLFDSTFNSNDYFKNKFIALCGESTYYNICTSMDKILENEEKIILLTNKMNSSNYSTSKNTSISEKISLLKEEIKRLYLSTQELIVKNYFESVYKSLINPLDLDRFRKKLYNFQEILGTTKNYNFFSNFYIDMMELLDKRFDFFSDLDLSNTYLIPKKENKFLKLINYIKKLILKREFKNTDI